MVSVIAVAAIVAAAVCSGKRTTKVPEAPPDGITRPSDPSATAEPVTISQPADGGFTKQWLLPLGIPCVVLAILSICLLRPVWRSDSPPEPEGGVLLFTEHELPSGSEASAVVAATMSGGYGSWLQLDFRLPEALPGERWYLVASGDWAPTRDLDLNSFCSRGNAARWRGDRVICDDDGAWGGSSPGEYRFDEGMAVALDGKTFAIDDTHDYYEPDKRVVVTGVVEDPTQQLRVGIPFKERPPAKSGSNTNYAYAGLLVDDFEYGSGPQPDGEVDGPSDFAGYALEKARVPLYEVRIGDTLFSPSVDLGDGTVAQANPPLSNPSVLRWVNDGGIADTSFTIASSRTEQRLGVSTFIAGIMFSVSTALAVLLLERFLMRRNRDPVATTDVDGR